MNLKIKQEEKKEEKKETGSKSSVWQRKERNAK